MDEDRLDEMDDAWIDGEGQEQDDSKELELARVELERRIDEQYDQWFSKGLLNEKLFKLVGLFAPKRRSEIQELARRTWVGQGIPSDRGFLCGECGLAFWTALHAVLAPFYDEAIQNGRLCRECISMAKIPQVLRKSIRQCQVCRSGVCDIHGIVCERCYQIACKGHIGSHACKMEDRSTDTEKPWWKFW